MAGEYSYTNESIADDCAQVVKHGHQNCSIKHTAVKNVGQANQNAIRGWGGGRGEGRGGEGRGGRGDLRTVERKLPMDHSQLRLKEDLVNKSKLL